MPLMGRRKGKPKPAKDALAPWLKTWFMTGTAPATDTPEHAQYIKLYFFSGLDAMRDAWHRHRDALVAECIAARPGTRPHYWWAFEYEDDYEDFPVEGEPRESYRARLEEHERESDAAALRRRGLLAPGELERIPAEAFEPVEPAPDVTAA